jgi:transcription elongation factor Elf1
MARNKVQFQKGMSLNIFLQYYGTEDQCFEALYKWRWPKGFRCPSCGHDRSCQLTNRKLQQCNRCHHQTSITAGTILESTKLPLTIWFQAIYLISQGKKCISVHCCPVNTQVWRSDSTIIGIISLHITC